MSCPGLHCASCSAGAAVPPLGFVATLGLAWVAAHLVEVAMVSATCGILSVAAVVALMRWTARREAAFGAVRAARRERPALTATVIPQVSQPATVPAIENHVHYHMHVADSSMAARVTRQFPGPSGELSTKEEPS